MRPNYEKSKIGQCETWTGKLNQDGRAIITIDGKNQITARYLMEKATGKPIEKGMMVCHKCDNPACVRLDHLFIGDAADNYYDALKKGRIIHDPEKIARKHAERKLNQIVNMIVRHQRRRLLIKYFAIDKRMTERRIYEIWKTTKRVTQLTIMKWSIQAPKLERKLTP